MRRGFITTGFINLVYPLFSPEFFEVVGSITRFVLSGPKFQDISNFSSQVRNNETVGGQGQRNKGLKDGSYSWFVQLFFNRPSPVPVDTVSGERIAPMPNYANY